MENSLRGVDYQDSKSISLRENNFLILCALSSSARKFLFGVYGPIAVIWDAMGHFLGIRNRFLRLTFRAPGAAIRGIPLLYSGMIETGPLLASAYPSRRE